MPLGEILLAVEKNKSEMQILRVLKGQQDRNQHHFLDQL